MSIVLVVNDHQPYKQILSVGLAVKKVTAEVLFAATREEALDIIKANPIATLLINLDMANMRAADLVAYMNQHQPATPVIATTARDISEAQELLADCLNVYIYLPEPAKEGELLGSAEKSLLHYKSGEGLPYAGSGLVEDLQVMAEKDIHCRLVVQASGDKVGTIFLVDGQVYQASHGSQAGEDALAAILAWPDVSLSLHNLAPEGVERAINRSVSSLRATTPAPPKKTAEQDSAPPSPQARKSTVPASSQKSPVSSVKPPPPSKPPQAKKQPAKKTPSPVAQAAQGAPSAADLSFAAAKQHAMANEEEKARALFTALLKSNPKNGQYWLWFSRVANDMAVVIKAQKNAAWILPGDGEVRAEGKKISLALQAGCPNGGEVWHCPFCWAPVTMETRVCANCKASQLVYQGVLGQAGSANEGLMVQAQARYEGVVAGESKKCRPRFNLALVHLNMGRPDEALATMQEAVKCDTQNIYLRRQFKELQRLIKEKKQGLDGRAAASSFYTVLVVEDSNTTRKGICLMLERAGYGVLEASDGMTALSVCKEKSPNLILLDLIMPVMDGYQVLSALKKDPALQEIPVIMLTARDSLLDKLKGKMSATDEYLTKPFKAPALLAKVEKYLLP
ncbi:MAG: response regulator [Thermodesulfobacteriota bacterium]